MSLLDLLDAHKQDDLASSIQRHLYVMFNTRKGSIPYDPEYGVPDINDIYVRLPHSACQLQQTLQQLIERYEPRLLQVQISSISSSSDEEVMVFKIKSYINKKNPLHLHACCLSTGCCIIEPCYE